MSKDQLSVNQLIRKSPNDVHRWLNSLKTTDIKKMDFNFLLLADISKQNMLKSNAVEWGYVALRIYEILSEISDRYEEKNYYKKSSMYCRVTSILTFGHKQNDILLDSNIIKDWLFEDLQGSVEELRKLALEWKKLDISIIRYLKELKIKLGMIHQLIEANELKSSKEIQKWQEIYQLLP
ncbi:hypothetical protein [Algivirga pacifica]